MDHLQHDIDSLENERGALRDKLKLYAKRGGGHHGQCAFELRSLLTGNRGDNTLSVNGR